MQQISTVYIMFNPCFVRKALLNSFVCLRGCRRRLRDLYKVSTNRITCRIKDTVSITDYKLLGISSKSHLPYLSFKRFCSLINNGGMNEQGG